MSAAESSPPNNAASVITSPISAETASALAWPVRRSTSVSAMI
jgi:hypothetical protein